MKPEFGEPRSLTKLLICLGFTVLVGCQQENVSPERQLAQSTATVVKPLYDDLVHNLNTLQTNAEAFCRQPSATEQDNVQGQWRRTMHSWQAASVVNFGPVTLGSMAWKFQFWPDRKNLIRKKVETAIASAANGEKQWSSASIAKASVVARGLGAVEYLLFDPEAENLAGEAVRCQYLLAVVGDMQRNAARLSKGWQEGEKRYPAELSALALLGDVEEEEQYFQVSALLVGSLHSSLEIAIRKLSMPLGKEEAQSGNPYLTESWRSEVSLDSLRTVLQSTRELYTGGAGYGLDDRLAGLDEEGLLMAEEVDIAYQDVELLLADSSLSLGSLSDAVTDQARRSDVRHLINRISRIKNLFAGKVPDKLGIPIGFNSNDGD